MVRFEKMDACRSASLASERRGGADSGRVDTASRRARHQVPPRRGGRRNRALERPGVCLPQGAALEKPRLASRPSARAP
jgi:hypothetical protein